MLDCLWCIWTEISLIPSFESSSVSYITPTYTSSMQELVMQGMRQKWEKSYYWGKKNACHVESNYILHPPKYLIIVVNLFIIDNFTKNKCSIPWDMTVVLGLHEFNLQATINHHRLSIHCGHYSTSINYCKSILFQRQQNYGVWNYWYFKNSYCLYGNV